MVAPISNPTAPNPSKLMAQLRMMPDQQLIQYAQMHKNDPYIFPMAFQESNTRKQMRAAQNTQAPPAPKVVDQNLQEMAQPMPEDQGIAMLPAPNMQNMAGGGIVAFDDGGEVPGYAEGVFTGVKKKYKQLKGYQFEGGPEMFEKALDAEGIKDPAQRAFLKSVHAQESDQALNAPTRDKSGAMGPMQVTKGAWTDVSSKGAELKDRADPFENMRAGIRYASTGWQKSGGDPVLAGAYYYGGPGGLAKAQKGEAVASAEDKGQTTFQYGKQVAARMPSMIPFVGTATAAATNPAINQIPSQSVQAPPTRDAGITALTGNNAINQIPGQSVQAPAARDESTFFGNLADRLGLSQETQRNISNTLMAPTPLAPVTALPKAAKSSGLAALGEKIYEKFVPAAGMTEKQIAALRAETEAARLAQTAQLPPRLTPPAQVLEQGSQVIPVTQAGEATVQSAANLEKARLANQAADQLVASQAAARTAQETAKLPSMAERLQQASYLRESDEAARLMNRARAATDTKTAVQTGEGLAAIAPTEPEIEFETPQGGVSDLNSAFRQFEIGQQNKTEGVQVAKPEIAPETVTAAPEEKTGGLDMNRLMLQLGLQLMAGKSPNMLTNIGEAGLGTLAMQQAEEKSKSERENRMSESEYRKAMGKKALAEAAFYERGAKDKNNVALAEKAALDAVEAWAKNNKMALLQSPDLYEQMRNKYRMEAYQSYGITPTMTAGTPAPAGGFSVVGSRPG
jgi:hypothetical protein